MALDFLYDWGAYLMPNHPDIGVVVIIGGLIIFIEFFDNIKEFLINLWGG